MYDMLKKFCIAVVAALLLFRAAPLLASEVETALERSMREFLVKAGIEERTADGIAKRYMFMGTVMIRNAEHISAADDDAILAQSEKTGAALGKALGFAYKVYGDKKLQDAATVMMHSVRAGLLAETASETFASLAANGYAFDATVAILHETSELVRASRLPDAGVALCAQIRKMASGKEKVQFLQKEIKIASKRERDRQESLMAQKEAERKKRSDGNGRDRLAADRKGESSAPGSKGGASGSVAGKGSGGKASSGASGETGSTNSTGSAGSSGENGGASAGTEGSSGASEGNGTGSESSGASGSSGNGASGGTGSGAESGSNSNGSGSGANGGSSSGTEGSGAGGNSNTNSNTESGE
jgi:hypothetical protein